MTYYKITQIKEKGIEEKLNDRVPGLMLSQRQVIAKIFSELEQAVREEAIEEIEKIIKGKKSAQPL